jgi:hypothetical protein
MDISLISLVKDSDPEEILFRIGENPPIRRGLGKLVQIVLFTALTTIGTDFFDTEMGGGLLNLLGRSVNPKDLVGERSVVNVMFSNAQKQILAEQDGENLTEAERLRQIIVVDVEFDQSRQELSIDLIIENELGERAFVRV